VEGRKIAGIAQARRRGGVLVHGSIILTCDRKLLRTVLRFDGNSEEREAQEPLLVAALRELVPGDSLVRELSGALVKSMEEDFGVSIVPGALSRRELSIVDHLVRSKYATAGWNMKAAAGLAGPGFSGRWKEGRVLPRTC